MRGIKYVPKRQCAHSSHQCIDEWAKTHLPIAKQSIHYYNLENTLTFSELYCLKNFHLSKTHNKSYLKAPCYLFRRLAQACNSLLTKNPNPADEQWYEQDWSLLIHCLADKTLISKLHPHKKLQTFSFPIKIKQQQLSIELISNYTTGEWEINNKALYRQMKHHFPNPYNSFTISESKTKSTQHYESGKNSTQIVLYPLAR